MTNTSVSDPVSEREKWATDVRLRECELELKSEELRLREKEARRAPLFHPLVLAIIAAALAGVSNAYVAFLNGAAQRSLETSRAEATERIELGKAEAARILELVKTGDQAKAAENLKFLVDTGLVKNTDLKNSLSLYLGSRKPGEGVVLPAAAGTATRPQRPFFACTAAGLVSSLLQEIERKLKEKPYELTVTSTPVDDPFNLGIGGLRVGVANVILAQVEVIGNPWSTGPTITLKEQAQSETPAIRSQTEAVLTQIREVLRPLVERSACLYEPMRA
jgi:hypothetical protein